MFAALGRAVYRFRVLVVVGAISVALLIGSLALGVTGKLSAGGWTDSDSESAAVAARLAEDFGAGSGQLFVVYSGAPGQDARSEAFQDGIRSSLVALVEDPLVVRTTSYTDLPDDRLISRDGNEAMVLVDLRVTNTDAIDDIEHLRSLIRPPEAVSIAVTGIAPITYDAGEISEQDLVRAELISLPLALLILITVFASIVAAGMPLLVAALAIPTTLGLISILAQETEMSLFVLNVASMLGLAFAIDYSLFVVSRFREELARGRSSGEAVEISVATAGKAVAFSALAVAIGLSGLLLFEASALTSMGVAGVIVVAVSAVFAVTFLPALLGMLGPRVNALSVATLYRRLGLPGPTPLDQQSGQPSRRWTRLARWVMAHPVAVLVPTLALLLILGVPFLQTRQALPDATVYPAGMESRDGFVTLQERFSPGETSPLVILAQTRGDPTAEEDLLSLAEYAEALERLDDIDRVESFFTDIPNPFGGADLSTAQAVAAYRVPALRELLRPLLDRYVRESTVRLEVFSPLLTSAQEAPGMVAAVRALEPGGGIETAVGGAHAAGQDLLASVEARVPFVVVTVVLGMLIALFLLFGSVVLPVKAVLMTTLSIVASFGALIWIFQLGNLEWLLRFDAPGYTIAGLPIVMFAVLFGLSMDYEVLLLSRIQESYQKSGDNTDAVADGLARTAGVITGAASIMVVVFASFALADIITVKALGVGMAIAVFLDATVVRIFLVPATMQLMGDWNWWAPAPLRRVADRFGLGHPG